MSSKNINAVTEAETDFLQQLERIRRDYPNPPRPKPFSSEGLDSMFGIFADDPHFDEMMEHIELRRNLDREQWIKEEFEQHEPFWQKALFV